ncbi:TetR/AcrR family transcriptional regulator [Streptacidiphilus albus]|uniref:TetR/AcrR family transcriptional regulator n=1 Tax=Streptacidiphilus albus TaxID=105425 RepID=UPI00054BDA91|nr:TetR/AcrR family transcriptional regulator [Streptacidiphilus albus]
MTTQTPRGDTRARIIDVALELFAEHGYEKTSLREIADRLGVTKAALYYHFRTKEDILAGIVDTMSAPIDEAIAWGLDQPYSPALRDEILRRFAEGMSDRQRLLRFFHENQPTIRELSVGTRFKERMIALTQLLQGPDPSFEDRVRAAMSLMVINVTHFVAEACSTESQNSIELPTPEERQEIALRVALDVAETIGKEAQPVGKPAAH